MQQTANANSVDHWTLREIYEQPKTLAATLERYVTNGAFRMPANEEARRWLVNADGGIVIAPVDRAVIQG